MKCGAKEIMWMIKTAVREYKQKAEAKQLGIAGLRRNGQLAAGPKNGKIVPATRQEFAWLDRDHIRGEADSSKSLFQQVGSHRYPEPWLEDRFKHIDEHGFPKFPD